LRELAELAGVSFVTLYRIEAGKLSPTVTMLEKLANALDVEARDFFPATGKSKARRERRTR